MMNRFHPDGEAAWRRTGGTSQLTPRTAWPPDPLGSHFSL